jgi:hypothetical protein
MKLDRVDPRAHHAAGDATASGLDFGKLGHPLSLLERFRSLSIGTIFRRAD